MILSATILAAGGSTRMESENKLLLHLGDKTIIEHVCDAVAHGGFEPIIVVTGYDDEHVRETLKGRNVEFVHNEAWKAGMAGSISTGVAALPKSVDGNLIVLGDMPFLTPSTLDILRKEFISNFGERIIYPSHDGQQANPVLFPKRYFGEIITAEGEKGCKSVLKKHAEDAVPVTIESNDVILDCDTKEDYFQLTKLMET